MQAADTKMLKVAAYCRVSTDSNDQVNSLVNQQKYFREYIERNSLWKLTEVYVDEGITGTSTKKRAGFNRMLADAQQKKFDLILTKEISRFARNTLDSIFYTRKLKELGIGVIFMNDNINTLEPDAELRLTIMSSIAQEESRKTSERVKWGQKRRMEQGVVFGRSMLGYDVKDGKMIINKDGAKLVKLIFHKFINEGKGTHVIAGELREAGIKTYNYMKEWSNTVILRILRNEKYVGDLVQKKTYTPCYLSHEKKYNKGEEEFVIIRNHHEPIIDREIFDKAQEEMKRRRPSKEQCARYSNRYCFSGKLKCGYCGSTFVSRTKKLKNGSTYRAWRCYKAANHGKPHLDTQGNPVGCDGRQINNEDLMFIMSKVIKNLLLDKKSVIAELCKIIKSVLQLENQEEKLEKLQNKIMQLTAKKQNLIELYINHEISKQDFQLMNTKLEEEASALEMEQIQTVKQIKLHNNQKDIMQDITKTIQKMMNGEIQDDLLYRNILNKIIIYDRYHMDIYLNYVHLKWSFLIIDLARLKRCNLDTPVGTEELAHWEIIGTLIYKIIDRATPEELKKAGLDAHYVQHGHDLYPHDAAGFPWTAAYIQAIEDPIANLTEDMGAEQKARTTYEHLINLTDDKGVIETLSFLREREIVHFQRFGEGLRMVQEYMDSKRVY